MDSTWTKTKNPGLTLVPLQLSMAHEISNERTKLNRHLTLLNTSLQKDLLMVL